MVIDTVSAAKYSRIRL